MTNTELFTYIEQALERDHKARKDAYLKTIEEATKRIRSGYCKTDQICIDVKLIQVCRNGITLLEDDYGQVKTLFSKFRPAKPA